MIAALPDLYRRYLRVLGVGDVCSGLEGLKRVVRTHLLRAPFENVSKLLLAAREGSGRFFTLAEFLDGIENHDLGGTCYSLNPYLSDLLRALGYEADLLGADMTTRLNCHTCVRVRIDAAAYHVDVGYGGPFREPIRLDRLPFRLVEGTNRYVLEQRGDSYEMAVFSGDEQVHGYVVHDPPRTHDFFMPALGNSFARDATFLNCLRICRFFEGHSVILLNRKLSIHRGTQTKETELTNAADWEAAFEADLRMPKCPARAAVRVLEQYTGKAFFDREAHAGSALF